MSYKKFHCEASKLTKSALHNKTFKPSKPPL
jgi:hypothetical protein